jgi:hypothetical protein
MSVDSVRVALPLFQTESGGSIPASTLQLVFERCSREYAVRLNRLWHSRLPEIGHVEICTYAFHARFNDTSYAVALWSHPVARLLPQHWFELRRLAISNDAPKYTASCFLSWMVRWFKANEKTVERLISYQDTSVHKGTIYKATGWKNIGKTHKGGKVGWSNGVRTRNELNGRDVLEAVKHRWEIEL